MVASNQKVQVRQIVSSTTPAERERGNCFTTCAKSGFINPSAPITTRNAPAITPAVCNERWYIIRRTTLMACDFGYGGATFQLAIEDALLEQRHPIEAEPIGALNLHIHKLPKEV